ncbi:hypothetical protein M0R45_001534 [Rubus argutus]|uniref:Pentatricopeptide repeat-containing protein n=1 Tax=Rubus argutus TaxID=59490 RepID=A0AAW1VL06_RUBAR
MERRGVVGTSGVYYELACCLCKNGRWQVALLQVEKMKNVANTKPLEVTFTGMIREMALSGNQIDKSRHASILVEASRAGKGYLLEHAFDTTLEAGEIWHQLLFIEMVIQATARHDYKRAATVVNTMAYAPFQVSERHWTDVFEKNEDGISQDGLEKLLDALQDCDVSSEATLKLKKIFAQSLSVLHIKRLFKFCISVILG